MVGTFRRRWTYGGRRQLCSSFFLSVVRMGLSTFHTSLSLSEWRLIPFLPLYDSIIIKTRSSPIALFHSDFAQSGFWAPRLKWTRIVALLLLKYFSQIYCLQEHTPQPSPSKDTDPQAFLQDNCRRRELCWSWHGPQLGMNGRGNEWRLSCRRRKECSKKLSWG